MDAIIAPVISIIQEINRMVGFIASLTNMVGIRHPFFLFRIPKPTWMVIASKSL